MSTPDPTRRALLGAGLAGLAGTVLAQTAAADSPPVAPEDPSKVLGMPSTPLGERSPFEDAARLAPTNVTTGSSFSPIQQLYGTITPTDLQFQRHHAGIPTIDPARHELLIHGLVDRPLVFRLDDLKRFPPVTRVYFLECSGNGRAAWRAPKEDLTAQKIDGTLSNVEWTGVPLSLLLAEAGLKPEAKWVYAEGGDAARISRSIPVEKALDDAMIAYAANGEPLRAAHGYPMRLLLPGWEGNTNVKWLRRLELADEPAMFRDETSKYAEAMADGTVRYFSFVNGCKSIITAPSHPARLSGPGWWPITGLAWSGHGRVARVDVSTDGGHTWTEARLEGEPLPKAVVRFVHPWNWDGKEAVIMSRATDEKGHTQPTAAEFLQARGKGTDYHYDFIKAWRVADDGSVWYRPDPEAL